MATDLFSASVENQALIALLGRLAQSADFVCRDEGRITAERIVAEMQRRVRRASGATAEGIHYELTRDGRGYVVLMGDAAADERRRDGGTSRSSRQAAHTGIYLERGTSRQSAQPFFFSSAEIEAGPHLRRLTDRITQWLEDVGR